VLAAPALFKFGVGSASSASADAAALRSIADVLGADVEVREREHGAGWNRIRIAVHDATVPLVVDIVADTRRAPSRLAYLLPGGGLDFRSDFFTPTAHNVTHHLREHGYLVIGISPRENDATAADITAAWGLAAHKRDAHAVIDAIDTALHVPYDLLGHSAGAALALDLAANAPRRLRRVMVLDTTGPYEGALAERAAQARIALDALIEGGAYSTDPGLKGLLARAVADPNGASAVPRPVDPSTRFTHAGLAHFALVHTGRLPGLANWAYEQGFSAGTFAFGALPSEDRFTLAHTPLSVWANVTNALGGGLQPNALLRDLTGIWAGDEDTYRIDWAGIDAEVAWVNAALGRGDHPLGAELIRAGGNSRVRFGVVPGYGHGDVVWGADAGRDVWPLLLR
jgi:pimeloyl-ACP methyl ester carboxylesterase